MSDKWNERVQGENISVDCLLPVRARAARCRGCDVWCVAPSAVMTAVRERGVDPTLVHRPEKLDPRFVWAEWDTCFSHPTLGFFCPKCTDGIGAKLAEALKPKDGEQ